jgi:hypothetical protein
VNPEHGTLATYRTGCRCEVCRKANAADHQRDVQRRRAQRYRAVDGRLVAPNAQHGTDGGYCNHGCRCRLCTEAHSDAYAAQA